MLAASLESTIDHPPSFVSSTLFNSSTTEDQLSQQLTYGSQDSGPRICTSCQMSTLEAAPSRLYVSCHQESRHTLHVQLLENASCNTSRCTGTVLTTLLRRIEAARPCWGCASCQHSTAHHNLVNQPNPGFPLRSPQSGKFSLS